MKHKAKYCCRPGTKWAQVTQLSSQNHAFPLINIKSGSKEKYLPDQLIFYEREQCKLVKEMLQFQKKNIFKEVF